MNKTGFNLELNSKILDLTAIGDVSGVDVEEMMKKLKESGDVRKESLFNLLTDIRVEQCTERSSILLKCEYEVNFNFYEIRFAIIDEEGNENHDVVRVDRMKKGRITRASSGDISSTMVFDESNSLSVCEFDVSGMKITLGVCTRTAQAELDENGGHIELEYTLSQNGMYLQLCSMQMDVKPCSKEEIFGE